MSKIMRTALSVGVALASVSAYAQSEEEKGFYVGGNVHYTNVLDADGSANIEATGAAGPLDPLLDALGAGALTGGGATGTANFETTYDDDLGYSAILGYKFANPFRLEFEYREDSNEIDQVNGDLDVQAMMLNLWYDFSLSERLRPYIGGGLGQSNVDIAGFGDDDVDTAQLGAGLYYHLSPRLVLDAGYRYVEAMDDPEISGPNGSIKTEYASQHLALGLRYNFFDAKYGVQDEDGDGVPDDMDQCLGTPAGVQVDSVGCPLDGDNDGVPDYLDQCLNTPAGAEVNAQGCELDDDNDGVVNANDMCPDTPAGQPVMSNGCGQEQSVVLRGVNFEFNSAKLTVNAETILDGVAQTLVASPGFDVELQGHTDSQGPDSYNKSLSQNRATSVKGYLVEQGVDSGRLSARGYGESQPIADNDTEEGRALNRRVELKVLGGDDSAPVVEDSYMVEEEASEPAYMMEEPMMEEDTMADEPMMEEAAEPMMEEAAPAVEEESFDEEDYLEESAMDAEPVVEDYEYTTDPDEIDYDF